MNRQSKFVRVACMVIAVLMALSIVAPLLLTFAAEETPKEKMERLKKEIEASKNEITRLQGNKEQAEQLKQHYLALANALKAQLAAIKEDIAAQRESINGKNEEIALKMEDVAREKAQFEQRMKGMYEMSRQSSLAMLLGIDDITQMQRFTENLQQITVRDTELVEHLRTEQAELERQLAELEQQLNELAAREQEATDTITEYANAIQQADNSISAAQAQIAAQEEYQADLAKQYEQEKKKWEDWVRAQKVDMEFNGVFMWPIPGYYNLSSDFGTTRVIYGVKDVHRGMDIPAPAGTPIYAAADGVVSTNNHWTYGISVKLSHGNDVATIYGHMLKRAVSDGQVVAKGDLIGYVGSTGNSTGNHLHFEVNVGGKPVSAWPYLKS